MLKRVRSLLVGAWQPSWVGLGAGHRGFKILARGGGRGRGGGVGVVTIRIKYVNHCGELRWRRDWQRS